MRAERGDFGWSLEMREFQTGTLSLDHPSPSLALSEMKINIAMRLERSPKRWCLSIAIKICKRVRRYCSQ